MRLLSRLLGPSKEQKVFEALTALHRQGHYVAPALFIQEELVRRFHKKMSDDSLSSALCNLLNKQKVYRTLRRVNMPDGKEADLLHYRTEPILYC